MFLFFLVMMGNKEPQTTWHVTQISFLFPFPISWWESQLKVYVIRRWTGVTGQVCEGFARGSVRCSYGTVQVVNEGKTRVRDNFLFH